MPGVDKGQLTFQSGSDGIAYFIPNAFLVVEVGIVDVAEGLLVPLSHGVGDEMVGCDDAMGGG